MDAEKYLAGRGGTDTYIGYRHPRLDENTTPDAIDGNPEVAVVKRSIPETLSQTYVQKIHKLTYPSSRPLIDMSRFLLLPEN